ncbi:MAG: hypothetical protein OEM62_00640 [Acidobacteriota bacterium]|nr:hypothetical protein [Acidobacteriota bacterium]
MTRARSRLAVAHAGLRQSDLDILLVVDTTIPDGALRVVEDDTYHVLSAEPGFQPVVDHPIRVLTAAWSAEPTPPGSVIIRQHPSPELLAVVYDLGASPPTCAEWVLRCLMGILETAAARQTDELVLPVLGRRFRVLTEEDFGRLLADAVARQPPRHLRRIVVPGERSLADGIKLGVDSVANRA